MNPALVLPLSMGELEGGSSENKQPLLDSS